MYIWVFCFLCLTKASGYYIPSQCEAITPSKLGEYNEEYPNSKRLKI